LQQQNFWLQQQKKIFVVPNFVAVKKNIFFRAPWILPFFNKPDAAYAEFSRLTTVEKSDAQDT